MKKSHIVLAASAVVFCSCNVNKIEVVKETANDITFEAGVAATKAPLSGPYLDYPMGLFAVRTEGASVSLFAENRQFVGSRYNNLTLFTPAEGSLRWPSEGELSFLSYSPYTDGATAVLNGNGSGWSVEVSVPVDNAKEDQDDLVGACNLRKSYPCAMQTSAPVKLEYEHLMSRVQVELFSDGPAVVRNVSIDNVCLAATQHLTADADTKKWDGEWINRGEPVSYSIGGEDAILYEYKEVAVPPSDGSLVKTGRTLDIGLDDGNHNGPGSYFQVDVNGELMYTRNGRFHLNQDGTVVDENGYILQPEFAVPIETARISVSESGHIAALDYEGQEIAGAEIPLYTFIGAPKHLFGRYYIPWDGRLSDSDSRIGSGPEIEGVPGQDNVPRLLQGYWNSTDDNYYTIGNHFDIAIRGEGYYQLDVMGELMYTRDGTFCVNEDGTVVDKNGFVLQPEFAIPFETLELQISPSGHIAAMDCEGNELATAEIPLYIFEHPEKLEERKIGNRIYYTQTEESGPETECVPGQDGVGTLLMGYRNEVSCYAESNPLEYGRAMLCVPDRKENEPSSPDRLHHSITVEIATAPVPTGNDVLIGVSSRKVTIPIGDEWLQGFSYTYKINCSTFEVISGQVELWKDEDVRDIVL